MTFFFKAAKFPNFTDVHFFGFPLFLNVELKRLFNVISNITSLFIFSSTFSFITTLQKNFDKQCTNVTLVQKHISEVWNLWVNAILTTVLHNSGGEFPVSYLGYESSFDILLCNTFLLHRKQEESFSLTFFYILLCVKCWFFILLLDSIFYTLFGKILTNLKYFSSFHSSLALPKHFCFACFAALFFKTFIYF